MKYDFKTVEAKWQKVWEDEDTFHAGIDHSKPKFYALVEFPYPSAAGLHVGHPRSYTALDIVARKKRQCGYNVLYPMGWDAFGLPTENFAMKNFRLNKTNRESVSRTLVWNRQKRYRITLNSWQDFCEPSAS